MDIFHITLLNIIAHLKEENEALKIRVSDLEEQTRLLKKQLFGQSSEQSAKRKSKKKSDKNNKQQSESKDPASDKKDAANDQKSDNTENATQDSSSKDQAANDDIATEQPKRKYQGGGGRKPLPEHLPRVKQVHECDQEMCPHCNKKMDEVGESIVETLAVIPLLFYVIEHIYKIYRCRQCSQEKETPRPPSILPRSQATPTLLSHIVISKLTDALPIYRQSHQSLRQKCELSRIKMTRWFIKSGHRIEPLVDLLRSLFNNYPVGGLDETRIQVVKEPGREASQLSCYWTRYGGAPNRRVCLVDYREGKDQETVNKLMKPFSGDLTCDMYNCFHGLAKQRKDIRLNGCHDHSRRRFDAAWEILPKDKRKGSHADKILILYDQLYAIERAIKGRSGRVIKKTRYRKSRKILNKIYKYIEGLSVRPNSKLGDAISYLLKYRKDLERFLTNPDVPISNILCEHIAKRVALARKNFLFAFSAEGAHAMANLMSLVYTAQLYKRHNLHHYLTVVFTKLPYAKTTEDLEALLPFNLTPKLVAEEMKKVPMPSDLSDWIPHAA